MKIIIAVFIIIHGFIHLLGFLKAFELAEIKDLKMPITRASGIVWLITFVLFLSTAILYLADIGYYLGLGVCAVTLSQALIWRDWKDAKYGSIPNLIFGIALFLSV